MPNETIAIYIGGGEPTILDLKKYISVLNKTNKKIEINILSNLSRDTQYFKELYHVAKNILLKFTFSFHREHIDSDTFLTKYQQIQKLSNVDNTLIYMVHNQECIDLFKKNIKKYPDLKYNISSIFGSDILDKHPDLKLSTFDTSSWLVYYKNGKYISENKEYIRKSFKYFMCPSFSKLIVIDEDGSLRHCLDSSKDTNLKYNTPNIYKELKKKPFIMCQEPKCLCHVEVPKVKGNHKGLIEKDINNIKQLN